MSTWSVVATVLFASWGLLMTGCGEDHSASSLEVFEGATAAYYCEYYEIAIGEALEPGMEFDGEQAEAVRATVRNTSRIWSSAFRDVLTLDGPRFALGFTVIPWPPKGEALADARPQGHRHVAYEGTWSRSENQVTLKVERVDGRDAHEPFELAGYQRGSEIEIRGARVDSAFSRIILWKRGLP